MAESKRGERMSEPTFPEFTATHEGWVLRIRERQTRDVFEDVESLEELAVLIKKLEGKVLHIKLLSGNDEYGPIEEGRGNYIVKNGLLCWSPEWKFEIRSCIGLSQSFNVSVIGGAK
jgi:hypothetical protein